MIDLLIKLFATKYWYDWPLGLLFWITSVSLLGAIVKFARRGDFGEPWQHHIILAATITVPFALTAQVILRHLTMMRQEFATLATTDLLTGLPNRRAFLNRVRTPKHGGTMLLDVDRFKRINDTYGHETGDIVLKAIADLLVAQLRDGDEVARYGGEEFAVFLPNAPPALACDIGQRLCEGLSLDLASLEGETLKATLSAGAVAADGQTNISALIANAEQALYRAKTSGRARLIFARDSGPERIA